MAFRINNLANLFQTLSEHTISRYAKTAKHSHKYTSSNYHQQLQISHLHRHLYKHALHLSLIAGESTHLIKSLDLITFQCQYSVEKLKKDDDRKKRIEVLNKTWNKLNKNFGNDSRNSNRETRLPIRNIVRFTLRFKSKDFLIIVMFSLF